MQVYDETIKNTLAAKVQDLESYFSAQVAFYYGEIFPGVIKPFRDFIELWRVARCDP